LPPDPSVTFSGDSVGLALGVCAFSVLTNTPVPNDVACTGILDEHGNLGAVKETQQKVDSLLIEHPEVRRILVARGSEPAVVSPDVEIKDDLDTLKAALDVIYAARGGCQGVLLKYLSTQPTGSLKITSKDLSSEDGTERVLFRFAVVGDLESELLRNLANQERRIQQLARRKGVLLDGASLPSWVPMYFSGVLANAAAYVAVHQPARGPVDAARIGWSASHKNRLGEQILWNADWNAKPDVKQ